MADIATLGLVIDSRPVTAATTALNQLTAAARPAETALARLESQAKPAANALANMDSGTLSLRGQRGVLRGLALDIALLTPQFGGLVGVASQLFIANQRLFGGFNQFKSTISGLITPLNLTAAGAAALGVGAIAAFSAWRDFALQLDSTARIMGTTSSEAAKLQAAASFKGIDSEEFSKGMGEFAKSIYQARNNMGGLADVFRANNIQARTFGEYMNGAADIIQRANGDLSRQFALLTQMGLPATTEWVKLLSGGADGLKRLTDETANFGGAANDNMVRKAKDFDEAWNKAWTNFGLYARSSVVTASGVIGSLVKYNPVVASVSLAAKAFRAKSPFMTGNRDGGVSPAQSVADRFPTATQSFGQFTGSGAGSKADDPNVIRQQLALEQQRIGLFGNLATIEQTVRAQEIAIAQARANGVNITAAEEKGILSYARAQALGTLHIRQQTEAEKINAGAVGLGIGATAAYRAEQDRLAEARLKNQKLSPGQIADIRAEAQALGQAAQKAAELRMQSDLRFATAQIGRTDAEQQVATQLRLIYNDNYLSHMNDAIAGQIRLNATLTDTKQVAENALSGFLRDLRDGKSAGEAFQNVLNKLEDKLFDIAANKVMSGLLSSAGGLFGGGTPAIGTQGSQFYGPPTPTAHSGRGPGDRWQYAPRFHTGRGPGEMRAVIRDDESVLTPGQMRALGGRMGGGAVTVNLHNAPAGTQVEAKQSRDANGNTQIDMRLLGRWMDDHMAGAIRGGESATHSAMKDRFNLRDAL